MKIEKVTVGFNPTINLGNYENVRPEIRFEMVTEPGDTAEGITFFIADLMLQAQQEVGMSLWPLCESDLRTVNFDMCHSVESEHKRAQMYSAAFRWMMALHPKAAEDMLADLIASQQEEREAEAARIKAAKDADAVEYAKLSSDAANVDLDYRSGLDDDDDEDDSDLSDFGDDEDDEESED